MQKLYTVYIESRTKLNSNLFIYFKMKNGKIKGRKTNEEELQEIFRRNFERQFGSVDGAEGKESEESEQSEDESEGEEEDQHSSHSSEDEDEKEDQDEGESSDEGPQVVRFDGTSVNQNSKPLSGLLSKNAKRKFMSSTAPKSEDSSKKPKLTKKEEKEEQEDLKNDLALQRLIQESHILAGTTKHGYYTGADISTEYDAPIGKARLKVMSSRLDKLGVKGKQDKIPMLAQRHRTNRETRLRDEYEAYARENGIVMASTSKKPSKKPVKRQRGLKIASVGRETKHGLRISKKDIAQVTGH